MITDQQVRWIALFFLFSLMDEKTALVAAEAAAAQAKALSSNAGTANGQEPAPGSAQLIDETTRRSDLIAILRKVFEQHRKLLARNRPTTMPELSWALPEGIEIQAWAKFQKDSSDGEVMAVVLSKILGFNDFEIAEGLHTSLGTARYRIGKGMRQLGASLRANQRPGPITGPITGPAAGA